MAQRLKPLAGPPAGVFKTKASLIFEQKKEVTT